MSEDLAPLPEGWRWRARERSAGVYELTAIGPQGETVVAAGTAPGAVSESIRADVESMGAA